MKKRTRKFLLYAFLSIFAVIAPVLILYVQGYRYDFEHNKLTQTGGLFVKTLPKQVEIYLDGKLARKTDFFFSSVLIENLLPESYNVGIKKEGYYDWEKNLEVKEKQVTEIKNVVLMPKDPEFRLLAMGAKEIWLSEDGKKAIARETEGSAWSLKLYNFEKEFAKTHILRETDFYRAGADLLDLEFTDSGKKLLVKIGAKEQISYFEIDLSETPFSAVKTSAPQTPAKNALAYRSFGPDIYYLDNLGNFYKTNKSLTSKEQLTLEPFSAKKETEYSLYVFEKAIFLRENKTLYLLDQENKTFEKFAENVNLLAMSPDRQKIAYASDNEIRVYFLEEQTSQPRFKKGDDMFLLRLSGNINDVKWINSHYLALTTADSLKIAEIDNRDRVNVIDLASVENPEIFADLNAKKLYLLDRGNLFVSDSVIQ